MSAMRFPPKELRALGRLNCRNESDQIGTIRKRDLNREKKKRYLDDSDLAFDLELDVCVTGRHSAKGYTVQTPDNKANSN